MMKPGAIALRTNGLSRVRWPLVLLLAVALLFAGTAGVYFARYLAKPNAGLVVNFPEAVARDGRILFAPKTPFSPAVAAGLLPNQDQILAVDGVPVRTLRDLVAADGRIRTFHPVTVEVLRSGVERRQLTIQPAFNLARPDWLFSLLFCVALGFTAFYLIVNRPEEPAFVLIALAALFYLVFTAVKPFYYENRLSNLLIHFGKLTSWFMVFFALHFPRPRGSRALRLGAIASILAIYGLFTVLRLQYFARWAESGAELWLARYRFLGQMGNVSDGIAFALYAALLISAYLRIARGQEKRQIEWILAGFLIAIPPYFFLDQLPIILGEPPGLRISMGNFANLFLSFVPLFFIVGLLKHRAFNLRFFLSRYAVYAVLVVLLLGFFTVLYEPAERLFVSNYGIPDRMAAFLVTTLLFLLLVPVRYGLSSLVDRVLYRRYYVGGVAYSAGLERRNRELQLLIEKLTRESRRSFRQRAFPELREVLRGIAHRIDTPARRISAGLAEARGRLARHCSESGPRGAGDPALAVGPQGAGDAAGALGGSELAVLQWVLDRGLEDTAEIREFLGKLTAIIGRHAGPPARIGVARLLAGVRADLRRKFPDLRLQAPAPVRAQVLCHPEEIAQVLGHVVQNAVEALVRPDGEVRLSAERRQGYVAILIEDSGRGVEPRALRRAFDPFFSTKGGHDGLGLYFCRLIVERNSGSIEIRPGPEGGTQVEVLLPSGAETWGELR